MQRAKTSEIFAEEKMFAEDISEDFPDLTFTGFYSISGYLRNLRGRLLSSEKFSEVFTLWVFTLKPFSDNRKGGTARGGTAKMRSRTRVKRNGAFGASTQGLSIFVDDYRNQAS